MLPLLSWLRVALLCCTIEYRSIINTETRRGAIIDSKSSFLWLRTITGASLCSVGQVFGILGNFEGVVLVSQVADVDWCAFQAVLYT